jgi:aminodeoxychorismate synthase component I
MFGHAELHFEGRRLCGRRPFALFESKGGVFSWHSSRVDFPFRSGIGDALEEVRRALRWSRDFIDSRGAAIGFFAYDFARTLEARAFTANSLHDDLQLPDARLVFYEALEESAIPDTREYSQSGEKPEEGAATQADAAYIESFARIQRYIEAGDIYQANLTRRFSQPCQHSARELFSRLTQAHVMPFSALLEYDDFAIVSNSPERFFSLNARVLAAEPIKGTARRGRDFAEDEALKRALQLSEKDRAENVMIVDLLRNDLGRVCEYGTVKVPQLCALRTFPTLHHLVSTVTGKLRTELDATEAMRALFPCGSISGAPKIRAMQILDELESSRRGVAMGAIGYFGFNGAADWNVAIRTVTLQNETAYFHVGGGITIGSEAQSEYSEMLLKSLALQRALAN